MYLALQRPFLGLRSKLVFKSFQQCERSIPGAFFAVSLGAGLIVDAVSAFDFLGFGASTSSSDSSAFLFVPVFFAGSTALALVARAGRVDVVFAALATFEAAAFFGGIVAVVLGTRRSLYVLGMY